MFVFWIQEVFFKCLEKSIIWNPEFENEKNHVIFYLYISENEIWECNNERNEKVSLNGGIYFLQ